MFAVIGIVALSIHDDTIEKCIWTRTIVRTGVGMSFAEPWNIVVLNRVFPINVSLKSAVQTIPDN